MRSRSFFFFVVARRRSLLAPRHRSGPASLFGRLSFWSATGRDHRRAGNKKVDHHFLLSPGIDPGRGVTDVGEQKG